jgi:Zn-dependent M28 family amino/carboxypeptidase
MTERRTATAPLAAAALAAGVAVAACAPAAGGGARGGAPSPRAAAGVTIDSAALLRDVAVLADDSMGGRRTGTAGAAAARSYIAARLAAAGVTPFPGGFAKEFTFTDRRDSTARRGTNVVGLVRGRERPDRYIVVSAHYDHLGTRGDTIYNGADDNASGSAALLAIATGVARRPLRHSVIFAAFDAEELGLQGARAFVAAPPVPAAALALDVNMDMVGRNAKGELFAAGTHHYPALRAPVEAVARGAAVTLRLGHDEPGLPPGDDWTQSSDHGPFHAAKIPFVYFGVEDHPDYHRPTDELRGIERGFYVRAVRTVATVVATLDSALAAAPAP